MVAGHFVPLAAFLVQAHPPALARRIIVLDPHGHGRAHACEAVGHHADQRSIAQADQSRHIDAVEQLARLIWREDRRLASFDGVLGPTDRMGGIDSDHLADDEPVEQHADRGEVLLDGRLLEILAERADVSRDMHGLDRNQLVKAFQFAPGEEAPAGVEIGPAGVRVLDGDGEELEEAARSTGASRGDDRRHDHIAAGSEGPTFPDNERISPVAPARTCTPNVARHRWAGVLTRPRNISTSHGRVSTTFQPCQGLAMGGVSAMIRP